MTPPAIDGLPDMDPPTADSVDASITPVDELPATTAEDVEQLELERDRLIRLLEVERLRQALVLLTEQGDPAAAERLLAEYRGESPAAPGPRTFELPVVEEGECRIRFGPAGRPDSVVRAALLAHGLAASRVTATGFGLTRPVAGNDTPGGRATNRRMEIVVLVEPGS